PSRPCLCLTCCRRSPCSTFKMFSHAIKISMYMLQSQSRPIYISLLRTNVEHMKCWLFPKCN
uniref:Uncharacterized protein n=1 Tax=Falco tinnunculus TaxID=100819 RepID=A0A8C4UHT0_FALTI